MQVFYFFEAIEVIDFENHFHKKIKYLFFSQQNSSPNFNGFCTLKVQLSYHKDKSPHKEYWVILEFVPSSLSFEVCVHSAVPFQQSFIASFDRMAIFIEHSKRHEGEEYAQDTS